MKKNRTCFIKKIPFFIGFSAMFLPHIVGCSDSYNEFFPTKKLLDSVVNTKIKPVQGYVFNSNLAITRTGRYAVYLVLNQKLETEKNNTAEQFYLSGTYQIKGEKDVLIFKDEFKKEISTQNTGITLSRFEANERLVAEGKTFQIVFTTGIDQVNQHFSEITLHVKKELKHSVFD